jgi:uncharacterized YigZ family protein
MDTNDFFKIVQNPAEGVFKDKGSRFLSYIYPILEESAVKSILLRLRKDHPKARHICYAYRWGSDPTYHRINDDGEPNGTAGNPILNQLKSHELSNTLLAVVRYFGGSLLGVPGLINAYKLSSDDAIQKSHIIEMRRNVHFKFIATYGMEKKLISFANKFHGEFTNKIYQERIELYIAFPLSQHERLLLEMPTFFAGTWSTPTGNSVPDSKEYVISLFQYKDGF